VFGGVAGEPGAGNVGPVLSSAEFCGVLFELVDVVGERFLLVVDGSVSGPGEVYAEYAAGVSCVVGDVFGLMDDGFDLFGGCSSCCWDGTRDEGALFVCEVACLLIRVDCGKGLGSSFFRLVPARSTGFIGLCFCFSWR